jgi:carboxyl-terminal processing protease
MTRKARFLAAGALLLVGLGAGFAAGITFSYRVLFTFVPPDHIPPEVEDEFRLMAEAWNVIERSYVKRATVEARSLAYGAIGGMVNSLGDTGHSGFLTPEMVKEARSLTQGEFKGIGAEVQLKDEKVVIVAPMDGSPAQKAGLKPGDIIAKVDGFDVTGLALEQVVSRILGEAGTQVTLTIMSPATGVIRDVTLTRARITLQSVSWARLPGTTQAHVRIASFSAGAASALKALLREFRQHRFTGLVLDMRNNPGGLLDEAIGVASQFLAHGTVLQQKNADGEITPIPVEAGGILPEFPMVVLVNAGSASAAEIVAGALQDAGRAAVVGEKTFGTGTVLNEFLLSDGSAMLLATQEWLTPAGRTIWHQGIAPDVPVALAPEVMPLTPAASGRMSPGELKGSKDQQLLRAVSLLAGAEAQ